MTSARDYAALGRVIDAFGADIAVNYQPHPALTPGQRATRQITVEDRVRNWHQEREGSTQTCTIRAGHHDPIMPEWPHHKTHRAARVAVIGPAPTWECEQHLEPGWSRAERLLDRHLRAGGIDLGDTCSMYAAWCWPKSGARGQRPPTSPEVDLWRPWVLEALEAADVGRVLLHGMHAVRLWRHDLKMAEVVGRQHVWRNRWLVHAIPHASSVLRPDGLPEVEWGRMVTAFCEAQAEGVGLDGLATTCIKCGAGMRAFDGDGVAWCADHHLKGINAHERAQRKAGAVNQNQGVLL